MERVSYPDRVPHRRQHEDLRCKVRAMQARSAAGEITMTIEAMLFLTEWIGLHTTSSDLAIGNYMKTKGLALV
jgi:methyl-accepting chemotaxis protein